MRIKSKQTWLKWGNNNTKYFPKQAKIQQSYNAIKELKDDNGNTITGQEDLKEHAHSHFQELYTNIGETNPKAELDLLHGMPSIIKDEENRELAKPIMEYEIRNTIWSLHADKAPWPNGFTINFYRAA